jgi:hypothetical protein
MENLSEIISKPGNRGGAQGRGQGQGQGQAHGKKASLDQLV